MKISTKVMDYERVRLLKGFVYRRPEKPGMFFRTLLKLLSKPELKAVGFTAEKVGMERLGADEPCLILMNHSSFIDLKIVSELMYPRPFNIVCTYDGFIGKSLLMRKLGCIPTRKFTSDTVLVRNMLYALKKLKSSVLMYPEASYSFDGTATPLPESLGRCLKLLNVPVVMIRTSGAFLRDPLYNGLQLRKVKVSARMEYLLSPDDIRSKSVPELNAVLADAFDYDHFREQREKGIRVSEPFRADHLNRVLYKCPACMSEGHMQGKGVTLTCRDCGVSWTLTELGELSGGPRFTHIPDWYRWQRECVTEEVRDGTYALSVPVDIRVMVNTDCIYEVGTGTLTHTADGFRLVGCDGRLDYTQSPRASYSLYSDFFWYELGDMICIGDEKAQYYCFPQTTDDIVAKARLAAEAGALLPRPAQGS